MTLKDLSLVDLMRYIAPGVNIVFILLLFYDTDSKFTNSIALGSDKISELFYTVLAISLGVLSYLMYRALIYPILNFLLTKALNYSNKTQIMSNDLYRWSITNENVRSNLSEWASQVHLLYTVSFTTLISILVIISYSSYFIMLDGIGIYIYGLVTILGAVIHHIRYKKFEMIVLSKQNFY